MQAVTSVLIGGNLMLGRLVKKAILKCGSDYPMGNLTHLFQRADFALVNLECAITTHSTIWSGAPKAFYYGAPPEAVQILSSCNIKMVNLANNHILDYDVQGLSDTLAYLKKEHICFVGAGNNEEEAYAPAYITRKNLKFAMVSFCDHQQDFAAEPNSPGMAYLDLDDEERAIKQFELALDRINKDTDWPMLSLHWGPNRVNRPSAHFIHLAHAAIDMGYKLLFGHSSHVFHGIEIYRNCPIIYTAGDLVDDYFVNSEFENNHQLVYELRISGTTLEELRLHPVFIEYCRSLPANHEQFSFIAERAKKLCGEFHVPVTQKDNTLIIAIE